MSRKKVLVVLGVAVLLLAGVVSYLAVPDPDGLEAATVRGCEVVEDGGAEVLSGECAAAGATDHALANSPLADYSVGAREGSTGIAGIVGAVVTLVVAFGLFMVLARRRETAPNIDPPAQEASTGNAGP